MTIVKIFLSALTLTFALLGLTGYVPMEITNPVVFVSLGTLILFKGVDYKRNGDGSGAVLTIIAAVFLYAMVIHNTILK